MDVLATKATWFETVWQLTEGFGFRLHIEENMSLGSVREEDKALMINDVSRAFFEADCKRKVCGETPEEDKTEDDRKSDNVGLLMKSLYGTRDAAMNWQEEVARQMEAWGFQRGTYNPCLFVNRKEDVITMVHGSESALKRLEERVRPRFEIKTKDSEEY